MFSAVLCVTITPVNYEDPSGHARKVTGSGSKTVTKWDSSGSCKLTLKIYYNYIKENNKNYITLTKVTGKASKPSPKRVEIKKAPLVMGQDGYGARTQSKSYDLMKHGFRKNGGKFSLKAPTTWKPAPDNSTSKLGANYTVTFQIGKGTPWKKEIVCNAY